MKNLMLLLALTAGFLCKLPAQKMNFLYQTPPRTGEFFVVSLRVDARAELDQLPTSSSNLKLMEVRVLEYEKMENEEVSYFEFFFLPEEEGSAEIGSIRLITDAGQKLQSEPQNILVKTPLDFPNVREGLVSELETAARIDDVPIHTIQIGKDKPAPTLSRSVLNNKESEIIPIGSKEEGDSDIAFEKPDLTAPPLREERKGVHPNIEGSLEELSPDELGKKKRGKKTDKLKKSKIYRL